jgi:hypothetical protein
MFSIVFCVRQAIFSCVSLKILVICLTSLPQYVKMAHFAFLGSSCVSYFVISSVFSQLSLRYIHFSAVCFVYCVFLFGLLLLFCNDG